MALVRRAWNSPYCRRWWQTVQVLWCHHHQIQGRSYTLMPWASLVMGERKVMSAGPSRAGVALSGVFQTSGPWWYKVGYHRILHLFLLPRSPVVQSWWVVLGGVLLWWDLPHMHAVHEHSQGHCLGVQFILHLLGCGNGIVLVCVTTLDALSQFMWMILLCQRIGSPDAFLKLPRNLL